MRVVVFYDACFAQQFGDSAITRVWAIMDIVEEMYSERDSLGTVIEFDVSVIPKLENSWCDKDWHDLAEADDGELGQIARRSAINDANGYVFLTGSWYSPGQTVLGMARGGSICNPDRGMRISISQYRTGSWKGGDAYTAEVILNMGSEFLPAP